VFTLTPSEIQQLQAAQNNGTLLSVIQSLFGSSGALGASSGGNGASSTDRLRRRQVNFLATVPGATADFSQALSAVRRAQRSCFAPRMESLQHFSLATAIPFLWHRCLQMKARRQRRSPQPPPQACCPPRMTLWAPHQSLWPSGTSMATDTRTWSSRITVTVRYRSCWELATAHSGRKQRLQFRASRFLLEHVPDCVDSLAVAVGDFDGDGNLDIAVTDSANNDVLILFGDGQGKFSAATAYATGTNL